MSRVEWRREETSASCVERSFLMRRNSGIAPGVVWSPGAVTAPPAALLFHGGSGHKRSERHLRMGRWLASAAGVAVIAIDGPYHGDRVLQPMEPSAYQQLIVDEGIERVMDRMTGDWLAAVSALTALGMVDDSNVSVFAMSWASGSGCRSRPHSDHDCGVPRSQVRDPPVRAAAPRALRPQPDDGRRASRIGARALSRPVDDAIFPRAGQFELFDALASADKFLSARAGQHAETHSQDEAAWQEFIKIRANTAN